MTAAERLAAENADLRRALRMWMGFATTHRKTNEELLRCLEATEAIDPAFGWVPAPVPAPSAPAIDLVTDPEDRCLFCGAVEFKFQTCARCGATREAA